VWLSFPQPLEIVVRFTGKIALEGAAGAVLNATEGVFEFCHLLPPEGFTTMVASKGLREGRAYLNHVPQDWGLMFF